MSAPADERYCFGDFELNSSQGTLCRSGVPVKIPPQPLKLLVVLLERPRQVISREELRLRIWGEATFVEFDQGLNYCIRRIRVALEDDAATPAYLETLPKQGYRFIAGVRKESGGSAVELAPETASGQDLRSAGPAFVRAGRPLLALAGLLAIAAAVWGTYTWNHWIKSTAERSIVVLPLTNMTGDHGLEYLSDGITSDVIRRLSRISALKVIAQTSSMLMKGSGIGPAEASRRFGVGAVLCGSVRQDGPDLAIDVEVTDGRDGSVILNRVYKQHGANQAIMQPAIVEDIVRSLDLRLRSQDWKKLAAQPTNDPEAANLYLRAESLIPNDDPPSLNEAARLLSSAVEKDPRFALALSELAGVHVM